MSPRRFSLQLFKMISNYKYRRVAVGRYTGVILITALLICSVPTPVTATALRDTLKVSSTIAIQGQGVLAGWISFLSSLTRGKGRGMPQSPGKGLGVKPSPPLSRENKEALVAALQVNPAGDVVLQSRQPMVFAAIPLDDQGMTVQGFGAEWETSNRQVVSIKKNGEAIAGRPGTAILTATAGRATESVRVTVIEGTGEEFGGKKKENSRRPAPKSASNLPGGDGSKVARKSDAKSKSKRAHASGRSRRETLSSAAAPPFLRDPLDDPLPDEETGSLFSPGNSVGSPPGRTTPGASTPGVATDGTEMPGSANFTFDVPVVSLPGRGLNLGLGLTYNSRAYNKSTDPFDGSTWMTYDVDSGWPAAGFRLGFGQIEDQGSFGFTLTDGDGTRHLLKFTSTNNYDTDDGTFIHFTGGSGWGSVFYPDGTRVDYGAAGGGFRSYPTKMVDRNGNFILISYVNGIGPKINSIQDTLGRFVRFFYAANGDLVAITAPGLTGQPDLQVMRFYYQDLSLNTSGLFQSTIHVNAPTTTRVVKYIYLPTSAESGNADRGFRYDYSAYGMMFQIAELRGMTISSSALDQTGSVSSEGLQAALTTYNYPTTPSSLSDVPKYTRRTDDWAGRTVGMPGTGEAPFYTFAVDEPNGTSTVTAPDNTVIETQTIVAAGQWNDGLVKDVIVRQGAGGPILSRVETTWQQDANGKNPRPEQLKMTNDAGQTTKVIPTYSTFNNVIVASFRGFDDAEVRRVETEYQTNAAWINRRLLHLPTSVRVFAGGASTPSSRIDYAYDTAGSNLTPRNDIIMHEAAYNPFGGSYDPATDKRGNITSVTGYTDAATPGGAITHATTYDIAGNVITTDVDCCQQQTFSYSTSFHYAYRTSTTTGAGPSTSTSVAYDFNTGLTASTTDENGQVTDFSYHSDSLRLETVDLPDGGTVTHGYNDNLLADAAGRLHFSTVISTKLDATRIIDSYRFFDGRGEVTQAFDNFTQANGWSTQDIEYDVMGRAYRTGHPYYSAGYGTMGINPAGLWTTRTFDSLGRLTRVDAPSGDSQNPTATFATTTYAGVFTTVTDHAGKQRRQKLDALGRVVRLDEPDANGNLGDPATPNQSTTYEYDALDNLIHIAQNVQHRYFKYDSLSRLTHERQVEQDAPYTTPDSVAGNNQWSRKIIYNSDSLVQDVYDARQRRTQFIYDGLNRVKEVHYFLQDSSPDPSTPKAFYYYDSQTLPQGAPSFDRGYATGRLVAMAYGSSTSTTGTYFGYDKMGRVVTQRQVTGVSTYALSYGYNFTGLLTSESYPSGRTLSYAYDEGARLSQVSEGATIYANGFTYEPHGGLSAETWGNGAVHSIAYNRSLQVGEIKLKQSASGAELQRFNYFYGTVNQSNGSVDTTKNVGQIGRIDSHINASKQWEQRFSYDSIGRLSTAAEYQQGNNSLLTWQSQYTFDRYGNRFQSGAGNSGVGFTPVITTDIDSARNRFISTGNQPIFYDAAGNITQDLKFRGANYSYDANGRQTFSERDDHTNQQTSVYDCSGQRVQITANGTTRQMVYDIFGQTVADYANGALQRENIYRAGELLIVAEISSGASAVPTAVGATPTASSVTITWTAASGATNYRVERRGAGGSYGLAGTTSGTSFNDTGATSGNAYLYRVCAANGAGNCVSGYSTVVMGAAIAFTDPTIIRPIDDPSGATVTKAKAVHITELRSAVDAVRTLAGLPAASWTNSNIATGVVINKADIQDLRDRLHDALTALGIITSPYTDSTLAGAPNGTEIKAIHITQLRQRATSGTANCPKSISQFVQDFYQGALGRPPSASELSQWTTTLTQAQAQSSSQLLGAAQGFGASLFNSVEYLNLNTTNAQYITDLYEGYLQRAPDSQGFNFWLDILNGGATRATIRQGFADSIEFNNLVTSLCGTGGITTGLRYVLSDQQGSARTVMNNSGVGTSSVVARHDYLPFGEEIWAGTGLRSSAQGFGVIDTNRHKFALTQRDDATGLDHTLWRKYDNFSGRWTSPDPYRGSMAIANPQSFNRYTYVQNDPVNFIDPTGLFCVEWTTYEDTPTELRIISHRECYLEDGGGFGFTPFFPFDPFPGGGPGPIGPGPGPIGPEPPQTPTPPAPCPPTGAQLANDPTVRRAMETAWRQSNIGLRDDLRREQGGWIYARNGQIIIRRARNGGSASIDLRNPPVVRGALLVGNFHTHPGFATQNYDPNPSTPDVNNSFRRGVPGLVISEGMGITPYGPNRRGSNPGQALNPSNPAITGYPGNSANTTGCPP